MGISMSACLLYSGKGDISLKKRGWWFTVIMRTMTLCGVGVARAAVEVLFYSQFSSAYSKKKKPNKTTQSTSRQYQWYFYLIWYNIISKISPNIPPTRAIVCDRFLLHLIYSRFLKSISIRPYIQISICSKGLECDNRQRQKCGHTFLFVM